MEAARHLHVIPGTGEVVPCLACHDKDILIEQLQGELGGKSMAIGKLKREVARVQGLEPVAEQVRWVLAYWRDKVSPRAKIVPGSERWGKVKARLKEGFTFEELMTAVDGALISDFHRENGYLDAKTIFRDSATVEAHRDRAIDRDVARLAAVVLLRRLLLLLLSAVGLLTRLAALVLSDALRLSRSLRQRDDGRCLLRLDLLPPLDVLAELLIDTKQRRLAGLLLRLHRHDAGLVHRRDLVLVLVGRHVLLLTLTVALILPVQVMQAALVLLRLKHDRPLRRAKAFLQPGEAYLHVRARPVARLVLMGLDGHRPSPLVSKDCVGLLDNGVKLVYYVPMSSTTRQVTRQDLTDGHYRYLVDGEEMHASSKVLYTHAAFFNGHIVTLHKSETAAKNTRGAAPAYWTKDGYAEIGET